jgi:hypothetical protein
MERERIMLYGEQKIIPFQFVSKIVELAQGKDHGKPGGR